MSNVAKSDSDIRKEAEAIARQSDILGHVRWIELEPEVIDQRQIAYIEDEKGRPYAVFSLSSPCSPDLEARDLQLASIARRILGPDLQTVIPKPLVSGRIRGLSFGIHPWFDRASKSKWRWPIQRHFLVPKVLEWLRNATRKTSRNAGREILAPLRLLASDPEIDSWLKDEANQALKRLETDQWKPKQVLAHNDLWKGNILINSLGSSGFVIIDWASSSPDGYGIYDLISFALSCRLSRRTLLKELRTHCEILGCDLVDAKSHLAASLAMLLARLDNFPKVRFLEKAQSCFERLASFY